MAMPQAGQRVSVRGGFSTLTAVNESKSAGPVKVIHGRWSGLHQSNEGSHAQMIGSRHQSPRKTGTRRFRLQCDGAAKGSAVSCPASRVIHWRESCPSEPAGWNAKRQSARRCRGNVEPVLEPHVGEFPRKLPCRDHYGTRVRHPPESWDPCNFRPGVQYSAAAASIS
jgi:hypothetical protein